jgi:hypothetical protein
MLLYLPAILWIPFSFLLHNIIHEAAHGATAIAYGGKILSFWPFPSRRTGYFTWAYVEHTPITRGAPALLIAPLVIELIWLFTALTLAMNTSGAFQRVVLVEIVSSNVDVTVWLLGWWNPAPNKNCDAERFRAHLGFSRNAGKIGSLSYLPIIALCGALLARTL